MKQIREKSLSMEQMLRLVPVNKDLKEEILNNYDSWNSGKRAAIYEMLWRAFAAYRDEIQNTAYELFINEKYGDDTYEGNMDLWERADELTWKYIAEALAGQVETEETIERLRSELRNMTAA